MSWPPEPLTRPEGSEAWTYTYYHADVFSKSGEPAVIAYDPFAPHRYGYGRTEAEADEMLAVVRRRS